MNRAYLAFPLALLWACGGPSSSGQGVKTPDQLVEDQENQAAQDEKERQENPGDVGPVGETDAEKKSKFDKRQSELELKRAQRSAESCPNAVTEEGPTGTAKFTLVFGNDGHVKEATISAPFDGTAVGKCALNAMKAVIVPRFEGSDETVDWEVNIGPKDKAEAGKTDKKGTKK